jgi:hypothetical protein
MWRRLRRNCSEADETMPPDPANLTVAKWEDGKALAGTGLKTKCFSKYGDI